jgi:hypothetical protein
MAIIGNPVISAAFVTDTFSGTGSQTTYTMQVAPATTSAMLVVINGITQDPSTYGINGTRLTFSQAPPSGTNNISIRYLGIPASSITSTAYRTYSEYIATSGQTSFSVASYTPGYINVYSNGIRLSTTSYTATTGATVVLNTGASAGTILSVESFYLTSLVNAIPAIPAIITGTYIANNTIAATKIINGSIGNIQLDVGNADGTGALKLPVGTTAQRPAGVAGLIRQNSTTGNPEWWDATTSTWLQFSQPAGYSVNYLVVAGGGGGGSAGSGTNQAAGGGGAGGLLTNTISFSSGTSYSIIVGAGGASVATMSVGGSGTSSAISTVATAVGGGGGGGGSSFPTGISGGSGGGGGYLSGAGGSGTIGQGNAGGSSATSYGGGGGGAGAVGGNGVSAGGVGGIGTQSSINGTATYYAGGGGGGINSGSGGAGGSGGGGAGSGNSGTAGTANTGGGGGGGGGQTPAASGAGGSGIVIISYLGSQRGTGGTVTSSGGYTIHTFTSSGTYNA